MHVGFAYNVKKSKPSIDLKEQDDIEFDSIDVIGGIKSSLEELGHTVSLIEADENAFIKLKDLQGKIDIVFNIAEGLGGDARESQIPIYCEVLKIPYTHSSPTTHAISLNKDFTKLVLSGIEGINLPKSFIVKDKNYKLPKDLKFPLIIKPNEEGSGKGILDENIVEDVKTLEERLKVVSDNFQKSLIVEEFIDGREFTVAIMGDGERIKVLPIIEQMFGLLPEGKHRIAGFELKWIYEYKMKSVSDVYECPAKLDKKTEDEIERITKEVCEVLEVKDAARLDYRLNNKGDLYFLEINTLPGINPDPNETSCYPLAARTAEMDFTQMVGKILNFAKERYNLS